MSVSYYADLLAYPKRIEAFRRAIQGTVRPSDRVLDVGTGLGTFAFFAAQAGAESVVAVDSDPVLHLAETLAAANGLVDRIRFVRGSLPEVQIEGEFDLIIFEDFPTSLLDHSTFLLLHSLQEAHLASGGQMLPRAARLSIAPVQSCVVRDEVFPLGEVEERFGIDWSGIRPLLANAPRKVSLGPTDLRGEAFLGPSLPLCPVPKADALRVEGRWEASDPGIIHGLALWFDLEIDQVTWISNAPSLDAEPWGQWLLPLDPPLEVAAGQQIDASVWRESLEDGAPGWLAWECRAGDQRRSGHEFAGRVVGSDDLSG